MGRHTKGRRKRAESGGPSIYFFIALAIGIALLIWTAVTIVRTPMKAPEPAKTKSQIFVPAPEDFRLIAAY